VIVALAIQQHPKRGTGASDDSVPPVHAEEHELTGTPTSERSKRGELRRLIEWSERSERTEMDSPGFRYTVSKNPFNLRAVWRFVWWTSMMRVQTSPVLSEC